MVRAMTAFCACRRFSAWSNTTEFGPSINLPGRNSLLARLRTDDAQNLLLSNELQGRSRRRLGLGLVVLIDEI